VAKAVQLLTVIHRSVKNEDGESPIQVWSESGHVWTIRDADNAVIAETDSRREAIQLVSDLLEEELAEEDAAKSADQDEAYRPTDTTHRPEPWRRKRPARVEQPPGPSAGMDGASKRKRKQSRIM
jgi:hypothetical protein